MELPEFLKKVRLGSVGRRSADKLDAMATPTATPTNWVPSQQDEKRRK